jgi:hypothetical protein
MIDNLTVEPMDETMILWRCLHGGPLDVANRYRMRLEL